MLSLLLATLLTQAPVSLPPLTERHCSGSGWCAVLPVPLYPGLVAALAPGTRCVREVRRRAVARETWAEVLTPEGKRGWVNRRYLTPAQGPCSTGP